MVTKIIAHRGYSQLYPENTLLAFKKAKNAGADKIELDLHLSKDKKLVVHHDYYLEVESGKKMLLSQLESDEIKKINIDGESMPFLEEVFEEFGDKFEYEIELKGLDTFFLDCALQVIDKFKVFNKVEFTSPHVPLLLKLKDLRKDSSIGLFFTKPEPWMGKELYNLVILGNMLFANAQVAHCPVKYVDENLVKILRRNNIKIQTADCKSQEDFRKAFDLKVDQLSTDRIELALKIRNLYERKKSKNFR